MSETSADQGAFRWTPAGEEIATPVAPPAPRRPIARKPRQRAQRALPAALPPDSELWDVHAAARFLGRSASWVYHKAEDGTLPARRLGGWGIRFIPAELRAWVASDGQGQLWRVGRERLEPQPLPLDPPLQLDLQPPRRQPSGGRSTAGGSGRTPSTDSCRSTWNPSSDRCPCPRSGSG